MAEETADIRYTVTSLTQAMKLLLDSNFSKIYIEGEISGFKVYPSGHAYFTLKDADSQISAVMFRTYFDRCKARMHLKDGAKVLLWASPTIYPQRGSCQLTVYAAKLIGEGDLMQRYIELKNKLADEGLFDGSNKKPLPFLPRRIGIVTSIAGAVIHDMCRVINRRFPGVGIRVFPAAVQGAEAPASLIRGIEYFNSPCGGYKPDLIIVARGGGSFEDLFCFNDESLVRKVASSTVPVISAVGHETDYTLCDFAADLRAGTPSIAAEIAVPEKARILESLSKSFQSLLASLRSKYESQSQRSDYASDRLVNSLVRRQEQSARRLHMMQSSLDLLAESMKSRVALGAKTLDGFFKTAFEAMNKSLEIKGLRLDALNSKLMLLSPYSVLDRGYSLTTDASGAVVKNASDVKCGDVLKTRLANGSVLSVVK